MIIEEPTNVIEPTLTKQEVEYILERTHGPGPTNVDEPEYEGPGLGKDEVPFEEVAEQVREVFTEHGKEMVAEVVELDETKPETAADALAELEKLLA